MKYLPLLLMALLSFESTAGGKEEIQKCYEMDSYRGLAGCYSKAHKAAEKDLDKHYSYLLDYLSEEDRERLIKSQDKWLQYRVANCDFSSPLDETSKNPDYASRNACLAKETISRAEALEEIIDWPVGCNGCPF
jgi:uncharacterized protein YecT (DUF1311 family)